MDCSPFARNALWTALWPSQGVQYGQIPGIRGQIPGIQWYRGAPMGVKFRKKLIFKQFMMMLGNMPNFLTIGKKPRNVGNRN